MTPALKHGRQEISTRPGQGRTGSLTTALAAITAVIITAFIVAPSVHAAPGAWSGNGPQGGDVYDLAADPVTPNVFYVTTRSGVYKSTDGGLTWADMSVGISRQLTGDIEHSRTSAGVVYTLSSRAVFVTNNGGLAWNDRSPAIPASEYFADLSLAPTLPGRVYLLRGDGLIYRSNDSGLTWNTPGALPAGLIPTVIQAHPTDANQALAAARNDGTGDIELYRTTNAGTTWSLMTCGGSCPWDGSPFTDDPRDIAYAGVAGQVYLLANSGLYKSLDFGTTWNSLSAPFHTRLAVNPSNSNEVFMAGNDGVAFSTDGGATWTEDLAMFLGNSTEVATSTSVIYNPFNPNIVLAGTYVNGVYRRAAAPPPMTMGTWTQHSTGLQSQLIRAIAVDSTGNRIHAGVGDAFAANRPSFRSIDGGNTWNETNSGLDTTHFRALAIDPNNEDIVYASGRKTPSLTPAGTFSDGNGAIYKSTDAGVTWNTIDNGIPLSPSMPPNSYFGTVRDILLDQFSGLAGTGPLQTLYVGGSGRLHEDMGMTVVDAARIYKSTDAGATWTASDTGLGLTENIGGFDVYASVVQLVQNPADATGNTLYAATFIGGCCDSGGPYPSLNNGVFRSTDGGANWVPMSNGLPRFGGGPATSHFNVLSLALDTTDPSGNTLYASVNDAVTSFLGTIYKTTDGGLNWSFSGTGLIDRDVRDLLVDPVTGDVYAAVVDPQNNGDGGVFLSQDGGASWSAVGPGFPPQAVALKLALDRSGANPILHAGTSRSLLSIEFLPDADTDGASDMVEANAPNGGDGNNDGINDNGQAEVASLLQQDFADGNVRGNQNYVTVAITPINGTCNEVQRVESVASANNPAALPPSTGYSFPVGVLRFRIPDCIAASVELIYQNGTFTNDSGIRVYTPPDMDQGFVWQDYPTANASGNSWVLDLQDGQLGDATDSGDNVILFQGGPAVLAEVFFRDGLEVE